MTEPNLDEKEEEIMYKGNTVPKVIRLVWTLFLVWGVVYFIMYGFPDLKEWLAR